MCSCLNWVKTNPVLHKRSPETAHHLGRVFTCSTCHQCTREERVLSVLPLRLCVPYSLPPVIHSPPSPSSQRLSGMEGCRKSAAVQGGGSPSMAHFQRAWFRCWCQRAERYSVCCSLQQWWSSRWTLQRHAHICHNPVFSLHHLSKFIVKIILVGKIIRRVLQLMIIFIVN